MKVSLALLTLNEIDGARRTFDDIPWNLFEDSFVLDGGSVDGTIEFYKKSGVRVVPQGKRGLGCAVIEALEAVTTDAVVFFHPDGNMNSGDLPRFKELLLEGYDFIIASRMLAGAYNEEDKGIFKPRKWANIGFARLASILWRTRGGYRITDPVNGFRGGTKAAFQKMALDAEDCSIDYQMVIRAYKQNLRVIEFPTEEGLRISGETKFHSIPTGITLVKRIFSEL